MPGTKAGITDHDEAVAATEALYAQIPSIECKGLCWNSCGPIDASDLEAKRLADAGHPVPQFTLEAARRWQANLKVDECPALGPLNALTGRRDCLAYEVRPIICRLWGVVDQDSMRCPHGCQVQGRMLTNPEAMALIAESIKIGGHPVLEMGGGGAEALQDMLADPEIGPLMERFSAGDMTVERKLRSLIMAKYGPGPLKKVQ